jgi:hypothetical protein
MSLVDRKSTSLTNRDASPRMNNPAHLQGGTRMQARGTFEIANPQNIGSVFRFCQVPTNATINSIRLFCDAITSAAADVGLYRSTENGGAVVDVDAYASAQTLATANLVGIEVAFEARNIDKIENLVWQDAGLTADPGGVLDIAATLTAAAAAAGTLSFLVDYTVP